MRRFQVYLQHAVTIVFMITACKKDFHVTCEEETINDNECSVWLAESGIPNAGFGVYTTSGYKKDDIVSKDMSIALTDVMRNLGKEGDYIHWTHDDYNWRGDFENEYIVAEKVSIVFFDDVAIIGLISPFIFNLSVGIDECVSHGRIN